MYPSTFTERSGVYGARGAMGRRPVTFQWVVIHGKPWKVHKSTGTVNVRTAQSGWHWPMIGVRVGESCEAVQVAAE